MTRFSILLVVLAATCLGLDAWPRAPEQVPWRALGLSFATLLIGSVFHALVASLARGLNTGKHAWQRALRGRLGLEPGEPMREAGWLKWSLSLLVWGLPPLIILDIWGLGDTSRQLLRHAVGAGIPVGNVQIVPAKLLLGIVVITLMVSLIRALAHRLEHRWLANAQLEPTLRETIATLVTYAAVALAILVGFTVAGFDLSNLALVAGGLGVSIGFGLQNIVNNFVSGIILLFERPIRTGDYITIGGNEGFVQRIRIRATEIETLNHQHIVIPNSLFIAEPVTNWSLRDPYLRITVSVGVAYGSDTQLVKRLLLEAAYAHELVLGEEQQEAPKPNVLFARFGDSSLDFELKVYVRQVAKRYQVLSDLNFAIDAAFREHGVTIPFPQRDLWLKNPLPRHEVEPAPSPPKGG